MVFSFSQLVQLRHTLTEWQVRVSFSLRFKIPEMGNTRVRSVTPRGSCSEAIIFTGLKFSSRNSRGKLNVVNQSENEILQEIPSKENRFFQMSSSKADLMRRISGNLKARGPVRRKFLSWQKTNLTQILTKLFKFGSCSLSPVRYIKRNIVRLYQIPQNCLPGNGSRLNVRTRTPLEVQGTSSALFFFLLFVPITGTFSALLKFQLLATFFL